MSIRDAQCRKVCRILDDVLANRPTERDALCIAVEKAFEALIQSEQRWIPCSERLPEESREYFVTLKRAVLPINLFYPEENTYEYVTRIDRFNGEKFGMPTVVAWWSERLPKPWEGDT